MFGLEVKINKLKQVFLSRQAIGCPIVFIARTRKILRLALISATFGPFWEF